MMLDYYKLKEQPFGVTPDPRFFYLSQSHREAFASLLYGIQTRRGFMSLIAEPGMGKTTILFKLLSHLQDSARTVFLFQTLCGPKELLRALLRDLGLDEDGADEGPMHERLKKLLVAEARQGRRVVVIIDEAQNLEDSTLEMVRMLSNFETPTSKLMQIILAGQPQLGEKLASPRLLQLRQRMSIFARIDPFNAEDTHLYLRHRLQVAGRESRTPLFTPEAETLIAKYGEGIPRNINNICFGALSVGCVLKQKSVREDAVREALEDLAMGTRIADHDSEEPAAGTLAAISARKPVVVASRVPSWRGRIAASFLLLFQILCFRGGGQTPDGSNSRSLVAKSSIPRVGAKASVSAATKDDGTAADLDTYDALKAKPRATILTSGDGLIGGSAASTPSNGLATTLSVPSNSSPR